MSGDRMDNGYKQMLKPAQRAGESDRNKIWENDWQWKSTEDLILKDRLLIIDLGKGLVVWLALVTPVCCKKQQQVSE